MHKTKCMNCGKVLRLLKDPGKKPDGSKWKVKCCEKKRIKKK